jgi:hypothetical protein
MNAVILKLLFYKLNNLDFLMIIMKCILICTPFTILPNYYVPSLLLWLTMFTSDTAFKRFTSDMSVKRESINMNGALVIIIHNWCRCSMAAAYRASITSLGMMVMRFAWMAHKLVSSNNPMRYASEASWRASTAVLWKQQSDLKSWATSHTKHWNGALLIKRSADFWYLRISWSCHRKKRESCFLS